MIVIFKLDVRVCVKKRLFTYIVHPLCVFFHMTD